ncbi:sigma-70 family RNA polymerase sigma factor [Roseivirga sp.]|uniref:sigma-70 family RNA polymerase sigma factor n=1 Tax=Roseivirga sp. TaxID=1964215 RepID=UPI003B5185B8
MSNPINPSCAVVAPVFLEYRDTLTRFIKSRVSDPIDSEELISQVMLKIYDYCEKLDHVRNIEAWLITIARNTVVDYFKGQQKKTSSESSLENSPEEMFNDIYEELEQCVPSLMKKLPAKYAQPLIDYELKGIPQKQLAVQYGMSESGLKSRVQRGRKMLKELFTEHCGHLVAEMGCNDCSSSC